MKYYQIRYTESHETDETCVNFLNKEKAIEWGCKNLFDLVGGESYHYYQYPVAKRLTDVQFQDNWFFYKYLDKENHEWTLKIGVLREREINFEDEKK